MSKLVHIHCPRASSASPTTIGRSVTVVRPMSQAARVAFSTVLYCKYFETTSQGCRSACAHWVFSSVEVSESVPYSSSTFVIVTAFPVVCSLTWPWRLGTRTWLWLNTWEKCTYDFNITDIRERDVNPLWLPLVFSNGTKSCIEVP